MEHKIENGMETGNIWGILGIKFLVITIIIMTIIATASITYYDETIFFVENIARAEGFGLLA